MSVRSVAKHGFVETGQSVRHGIHIRVVRFLSLGPFHWHPETWPNTGLSTQTALQLGQDFGNGFVPVKRFCACGLRCWPAVLSLERSVRFPSSQPSPEIDPGACDGPWPARADTATVSTETAKAEALRCWLLNVWPEQAARIERDPATLAGWS